MNLDLSNESISFGDSLIALCFILSGIFGLFLFFTRFKKSPTEHLKKIDCDGESLAVFNALTGYPIGDCDVLFLRDNIVHHKQRTSKSGQIKLNQEAAHYDKVRFSARGFMTHTLSSLLTGNSVNLIPNRQLSHLRTIRRFYRLIRVMEVILLIIGTLSIPFFASGSTITIFLLAAVSLWILQLKRYVRPSVKLRIINSESGMGIDHAHVVLHHTKHLVQDVSTHDGLMIIEYVLPLTISVYSHGYYPVIREVLPATAIVEGEILIPVNRIE